jgi:alpha-glucosidase (family GH31 glycosyl hydrolase)
MNNFSDIVVSNTSNGTNATLMYPNSTINVHLRPGYIVPRQDEGNTVNSTAALRSMSYNLYINRDKDGNAQGRLYLDKNDDIASLDNKVYEDYTIVLSKK